jgi:hypothetical protein
MKTVHKKSFAVSGLVAVAVAVLVGCATQTLEQQIAVKEPGSWDFKVDKKAGGTEYIRIYDSPGKLGWFKYEYGQKHPCNQGFQKVIKTTAPGLVRYAHDPDAKSFACSETLAYIFRTDAQGQPYEGWFVEIKGKEKREFAELTYNVKYWDDKGFKPNYFLVK